MFKSLKRGLSHMSARGSHSSKKNGSQNASETRSEASAEAGTTADHVSTPPHPPGAPPGAPLGPKSIGIPVGGPIPPGFMGKGHLPPGVKILTGPPPMGVMKVMSQGSGTVSPQRTPSPGTPPPGMKMLTHLPPGAKILSGSPPPGLKIMNSPPPGAKIMMGSPPSPPLNAMSSKRTPSPPMQIPPGLPPGVKLMKGPPLMNSRPMSPEGLNVKNPPVSPPRPISPVAVKSFRVLPNGMKVMVGPPPPNAAKMKVAMGSSPPQSPSPPPNMLPTKGAPMKSPPMKLMIKTPPSKVVSGHGSLMSTPQLIPSNASFSVGPKKTPAPIPTVMASPPLQPRMPPSDAVSTTASGLHIPQPPAPTEKDAEADDKSMDFFNEDDINFEEAPDMPSVSRGAPKSTVKKRSSVASSSSSFIFHEDPDAATALPQQQTTVNQSPSNSSLQSIQIKPESSKAELAASPKRKKSSHQSRHRHHRSSRKEKKVSRPRSRASSSRSISDRSDSGAGFVSGKDIARLQATLSPKTEAVVPQADRYSITMSDDSFTPAALTSASRSRIADDFLSMLCPQQYYGKVKRIHHIRPFRADRSKATGLRNNKSIYVATKGVVPNSYFFPQLRLYDNDGEKCSDGDGAGSVDTPIILYEAAPGNMIFAETELDARRLLENSTKVNSCFILSNAAILFKNPEHYVLPIASLSIQWIPYASPKSEPQCPTHKRELQLFDPYTKELVCALCASKAGTPMSNYVVVPDVLGNAESRRSIQEKVTRQLDAAQQSAKRWVAQHQRVRNLCENKKEAVNQQFDLLLRAVEAKRKEYLEACDAEFAYVLTDVARDILIADEKVQLLSAATDHLHTDPTKPLFSMQIATIAEGLSAMTDMPAHFARSSLQLPPMSSGIMPNLETVMSDLQQLNPQQLGGGVDRSINGKNGATGAQSVNRDSSHSPYSPQQGYPAQGPASPRAIDDSVHLSPRNGTLQKPTKQEKYRNSPRDAMRYPSRGQSVVPQLPEEHRNATSQRRSGLAAAAPSPYTADAVSVPNSTGTSLFDFPLQSLLTALESSIPGSRAPRCIQWSFWVEDPGDWVGIGVGVGSHIDVWERGTTNDLSHLWIVPQASIGQTFQLRVVVNSNSGHARLGVYDQRGRQLDDGSIPLWNASRPAYPQATFGGRAGIVRMVEIPHTTRL